MSHTQNVRERLFQVIKSLETYRDYVAGTMDIDQIQLLKDAHTRIIYLEKENNEMFHSLHPEQMGG